MSDEFEQQEWVKFGVAAALSRQYSEDQRTFLASLVGTLQTALPESTEVKYRGGLFSRKSIQRVTVTIGENRYGIEDSGSGGIHAFRTRVVRGIALKTEEMPVAEWVTEIGAGVDAHAASNASARAALSKFLG